MTYPHVSNPFETPATESEGRMSFGTLRIFTNKVNLVKGASYVVNALGIDPDPNSPLNCLTDKNGNLWELRGKQLASNGMHTHVLVVITQRASDERLYNNFRDFMYWQADVCQRVTMPSLKQHFGDKLQQIWGKSAEVQAEIVEIEDGGYTRQAFKILKVFDSPEARQKAEEAFFSQFHQTGDNIADEIPGFEDESVPWDENDGGGEVKMSKQQALDLLPTLWIASGQNFEKFKTQLEGMPVVTAALGGIDADEIKAYQK